jgi:uncharacterized OsmC-like protein
MDAAALRAQQAPLKERYRVDPASAATPLKATAQLSGPGVSVQVETWAGPVRAGLHRATGGDGTDACSGDLLMEALAACAGVTLRSVALAMGIEIRSGELRVQGSFDARGTLAVAKDAPVGATHITIVGYLDTDADEQQLAKLSQLTERYCVVGQSLRDPATIELRRTSATSGTAN